MKRFFSLIAAILMVFAMAVGALADSPVSEEYSLTRCEVTYRHPSSFCIIIPETIDLSQPLQLRAEYVDITADEVVNVYCDILGAGGIRMTGEHGDTIQVGFSNTRNETCVASSLDMEYTSAFQVYGYVLDGSIPRAGQYTGVADFTIRIEPTN